MAPEPCARFTCGFQMQIKNVAAPLHCDSLTTTPQKVITYLKLRETMRYRLLFYLYVLATFCLASDDFTIRSGEEFLALGDCAKLCFSHGAPATFEVFDTVLEVSGCTSNRVNSCACRSDKQSIVIENISKCAYSSCTKNQRDIASATKVYENYCTSVGIKRDPVTTTITSEQTQAVATVEVTKTTVVIQTTSTSNEASIFRTTGIASELILLLVFLLVSSMHKS